jgi:inward rectifier potassium channel
MGTTWRRLLGLFVSAYLLVNSLYAGLYLLGGEGTLLNVRPGSFADAFWFSVETFATIGYGVFAPRSVYAHVLVTTESFAGLLSAALATGIVFAKFSRPTARVQFSKQALTCVRNGRPMLVFRAGNLRSASLVDVQIKVHALIDEVSKEGHEMRRAHALKLERTHMPVFLLAWSIFHPIDDESPLQGITAANVRGRFVSLIVTFAGVDDTMVQTVHARHLYTPDDIRFGTRFADMMDRSNPEKLIIDYERFDALEPDGGSE